MSNKEILQPEIAVDDVEVNKDDVEIAVDDVEVHEDEIKETEKQGGLEFEEAVEQIDELSKLELTADEEKKVEKMMKKMIVLYNGFLEKIGQPTLFSKIIDTLGLGDRWKQEALLLEAEKRSKDEWVEDLDSSQYDKIVQESSIEFIIDNITNREAKIELLARKDIDEIMDARDKYDLDDSLIKDIWAKHVSLFKYDRDKLQDGIGKRSIEDIITFLDNEKDQDIVIGNKTIDEIYNSQSLSEQRKASIISHNHSITEIMGQHKQINFSESFISLVWTFPHDNSEIVKLGIDTILTYIKDEDYLVFLLLACDLNEFMEYVETYDVSQKIIDRVWEEMVDNKASRDDFDRRIYARPVHEIIEHVKDEGKMREILFNYTLNDLIDYENSNDSEIVNGIIQIKWNNNLKQDGYKLLSAFSISEIMKRTSGNERIKILEHKSVKEIYESDVLDDEMKKQLFVIKGIDELIRFQEESSTPDSFMQDLWDEVGRFHSASTANFKGSADISTILKYEKDIDTQIHLLSIKNISELMQSEELTDDQKMNILSRKNISEIMESKEELGDLVQKIWDTKMEQGKYDELSQCSLSDILGYEKDEEGQINIFICRRMSEIMESKEELGDLVQKIWDTKMEQGKYDELSRRPLLEIREYVEDQGEQVKILLLKSSHELGAILEYVVELFQNNQENAEVHRLLIRSVSATVPDIARVLLDPIKMGGKQDVIATRLADYIQNILAESRSDAQDETGVDIEKVLSVITNKLREIKRIYTSSDTVQSERNLIFAEGLEAYNPLIGESERVDEKVKERIRGDVRSILIESGNMSELHSLELMMADDKTSDEEKIRIQEMLDEARHIFDQANNRNKEIARSLEHVDEKERAERVLSAGVYTHGTRAEFLEGNLEQGFFCGELLGSGEARTDASGLFGTDTCRVPEEMGGNTMTERLKLGNEGWGDIVIVVGAHDEEKRPAWHAQTISENHYNIPYGIATTEITTVVQRNKDEKQLNKIKHDVAWKGLYIPIVDTDGNNNFSVEEFEQMSALYGILKKQGYSLDIAQDIYAYYMSRDTLSEKHNAILTKAVDALQQGNTKIDIAVLVETIREDSLNWHDDEWYQTKSFDEIYDFFIQDRTRLAQKEVRKRLFGDEQAESMYQRDKSSMKPSSELTPQYHAHLDAFMDRQVTLSDIPKRDIEKSLVDVMMRPIQVDRIKNAAESITEVKKQVLIKGLEQAWQLASQKIESIGIDNETLEKIKKSLVPVMSGSLGRGEAVLGSDLDFLFLFDDEEHSDISTDDMKRFVDELLTPALNNYLEQSGIRPDAGLARADSNPFVKMSDVRTFQIDLSSRRQAEEPTELLDIEAIFDTDTVMVERTKLMMMSENESIGTTLVSYIEKDLEVGSDGKASFVDQFEELYASFAQGMDIQKIKESVQRVSTFKIYDLVARAFTPEFGIDTQESAHIPSDLFEKLDWLSSHDVISEKDTSVWKDFMAVSYKLRMMSEFFSEESSMQTEDNIPKKVKDTELMKRTLSFQDRKFILNTIRDFRDTILYK